MCVCVQEQPLGQVSLVERHENILVGAVAVEIRHAVDNLFNLIRLEELNPLRHTCELEGTSGLGVRVAPCLTAWREVCGRSGPDIPPRDVLGPVALL